MDKLEFENVVNLAKDVKNLPNSKLVEILDNLSSEFDSTKETIIKYTYYLDSIEELYNTILKEYQNRK